MSLTTPTVTGYSAFWSNILSPTQPASSGYSMLSSRARSAYHVAKFFKQRGMADARGALAALIGVAAGDPASVSWKRRTLAGGPAASTPVSSDFGDFGGAIDMETVYSINRVTTAADVTELKKWFSPTALLEAQGQYGSVTGSSPRAGSQIGGTSRF